MKVNLNAANRIAQEFSDVSEETAEAAWTELNSVTEALISFGRAALAGLKTDRPMMAISKALDIPPRLQANFMSLEQCKLALVLFNEISDHVGDADFSDVMEELKKALSE